MMNMIKSNLILWILLKLRRLEKQLLCTIRFTNSDFMLILFDKLLNHEIIGINRCSCVYL